MSILDQLMESDPLPPASDFKPSPEQQVIFDHCRNDTANLLVNAVAGSGKTTTICEATRHIMGSNLFVAFNRHIVAELKQRPIVADVKTLNSLGAGVCYRYGPQAELDEFKVRRILRALMPPDLYEEFGGRVRAMVSMAKSNALGIERGILLEDFRQLAAVTDLPFERLEDFAMLGLKAFERSVEDRSTLDFDDQIYWPLKFQWPFRFWSNVFVDEDQDLNPLQHLLLDRLHQAGSRIIGVGDRWQSIYAFRGAATNSVDLLKQRFQCLELPLSVSYRCASSIVKLAQEYCPMIQAKPGAPEGFVLYRQDEKLSPECYAADDPQFWPADHMVLCRNNAPLFRAIMRYIRAQRPCRVRSNFLTGFKAFFESFDCSTTLELESKLDIWFTKERSAAEKTGFRSKVAALQDKYDTARVLCRGAKTVSDIIKLLERLAASSSGTIFSTIHGAKGHEAESVYLLRPDLCPSPFAETPEAKQQELNLLYVAFTRAKLQFTFGVPLL